MYFPMQIPCSSASSLQICPSKFMSTGRFESLSNENMTIATFVSSTPEFALNTVF